MVAREDSSWPPFTFFHGERPERFVMGGTLVLVDGTLDWMQT